LTNVPSDLPVGLALVLPFEIARDPMSTFRVELEVDSDDYDFPFTFVPFNLKLLLAAVLLLSRLAAAL